MIKLAILDVDGVLTDGKKYYDQDGKVVMKTFCDKDWTAIKRLKTLGINVIFLTGDPWNKSIAENRNIPVIVNRSGGTHTDKSLYIDQLAGTYNVAHDEMLYIGDDIFDVEIMKKLKHSFCPNDSADIVKQHATCVDAPGGKNCIMALLELLQSQKLVPHIENFDQHLKDVYEIDIKEKF